MGDFFEGGGEGVGGGGRGEKRENYIVLSYPVFSEFEAWKEGLEGSRYL